MNDVEKKLAIMNEGKTAVVVMGELGPVLSEKKEICLTKFLQYYREGSLDLSKSLACAAELCSLEDVATSFKQKINMLERINRKELNASRDSNDNNST